MYNTSINIDGRQETLFVDSGLPQEYQKAMLINHYQKRGDYSVTELLDAPRCARLKQEHPEVETDAENLIHSVLGTAMHVYFDTHLEKSTPGLYTEVPMSVKVDGKTVTGTFDELLLTNTHMFITDLKNWNVFKWMAGEWSKVYWQLNYYHYMLAHDPEVKALFSPNKQTVLRVVILFKDWNKRDADIHKDKYPPQRGVTVFFKPLPLPEVKKHLKARLNAHRALESVPEPEWPDAPADKVWQKCTAIKVYKKDNPKKAINGGVFSLSNYNGDFDKANAQAYLLMKSKGEHDFFTKEVWTERKRCERYCPVSEFCTTYRKHCAAKNNPKVSFKIGK